MFNILPPLIKTVTGQTSRPVVAIFSGSHGDELAGPRAVHILADKLFGAELISGTVHFVVTNPTAVERRVRSINTNLNRRFFANNSGEYPEDGNAHTLMKLLSTCDALLDLHEHKDLSVSSLALCEIPSVQIAMQLPVKYVITGMFSVDPDCTDTFMFYQKKIGICYEAGHISDYDANVQRHLSATMAFLSSMGVINWNCDQLNPPSKKQPLLVRITHGLCRNSSSFVFAPNILPMKPMIAGQLIAKDGYKSYFAKDGELLIFPRPNVPIGANACLVGTAVNYYSSL